MCTHQSPSLVETILMSTLNMPSLFRKSKRFPEIAMISSQWLELSNVHGRHWSSVVPE